ncbi:hypothetical protein [Pseudomonas sp.]|uniref:hypothetical protein n=1 Tax=Pseudomonas sp. TaxID=306 RepID=UPI0035639EB2
MEPQVPQGFASQLQDHEAPAESVDRDALRQKPHKAQEATTWSGRGSGLNGQGRLVR